LWTLNIPSSTVLNPVYPDFFVNKVGAESLSQRVLT
jgi:hypothetical protein